MASIIDIETTPQTSKTVTDTTPKLQLPSSVIDYVNSGIRRKYKYVLDHYAPKHSFNPNEIISPVFRPVTDIPQSTVSSEEHTLQTSSTQQTPEVANQTDTTITPQMDTSKTIIDTQYKPTEPSKFVESLINDNCVCVSPTTTVPQLVLCSKISAPQSTVLSVEVSEDEYQTPTASPNRRNGKSLFQTLILMVR